MTDFVADIAALGGVELPSATSTPDVQVNQSASTPPSPPVVEALPVPVGEIFLDAEGNELVVLNTKKSDVTKLESYNKAKSKWDTERQALLAQRDQLGQQLSMFQRMQLEGQRQAEEAAFQQKLAEAPTPYEKARLEVERRAQEVQAREQALLQRQEFEAAVDRLEGWSRHYVENRHVPPEIVNTVTAYAWANTQDPLMVHQFREYAIGEWLAGNRPNGSVPLNNQTTSAPAPVQDSAPAGIAPVPVVSPNGAAPGKPDPVAMFYSGDWDRLDKVLNRRR